MYSVLDALSGPPSYSTDTLIVAAGQIPVYALNTGHKYWVPDPATLTAVFGPDAWNRIETWTPEAVAQVETLPWALYPNIGAQPLGLPSLTNVPPLIATRSPLSPPSLSPLPVSLAGPNGGPGSSTNGSTGPLRQASTAQLLIAAIVVALFFL